MFPDRRRCSPRRTAPRPAGCADLSLAAGPGPLTLVVGARANSPRPVLPAEIQGLVRESSRTSQAIRVIQIDGAPRVTLEATFRTNAQSTQAQQNDLEKFSDDFGTALGQITPQQAEADVFEALRTAALTTPSGGTIVLMDSGIPTRGQLSFLEGDLFAAAENPDEITGYLRTNNLLPDLSGRSIILVGLGQTAEPQAELNEICAPASPRSGIASRPPQALHAPNRWPLHPRASPSTRMGLR